LWRKLHDNEAAAQLALSATQEDYRALRLSLVAGTARTWFDVLEARQLSELLATRLHNLEESRAIIASRYRSGLGSSLDLYLANTNVQQEKARLIQQQQALRERLHALQLLVGDYPSGEMETTSQLPVLAAKAPAGLPADLVQRRPDIRAAYFTMQQANVEIAVAHKNRFPSFNLTAGGGVNSDGFNNLFDQGNLFWSLLAGVTQPIFNGGRLKAQEHQAELTLVQREQAYLQTVYTAFSEVESALQSEALLHDRYQAYVLAQSDAQHAENLAFEQYRAGLADFTTVLEAQRRALDTQVSVIQLRNQLIQNRIALHLALGSDFGNEVQARACLGFIFDSVESEKTSIKAGGEQFGCSK
jgi:NodT family efflux transporter outer membrane factor (OMF) lipoprotein